MARPAKREAPAAGGGQVDDRRARVRPRRRASPARPRCARRPSAGRRCGGRIPELAPRVATQRILLLRSFAGGASSGWAKKIPMIAPDRPVTCAIFGRASEKPPRAQVGSTPCCDGRSAGARARTRRQPAGAAATAASAQSAASAVMREMVVMPPIHRGSAERFPRNSKPSDAGSSLITPSTPIERSHSTRAMPSTVQAYTWRPVSWQRSTASRESTRWNATSRSNPSSSSSTRRERACADATSRRSPSATGMFCAVPIGPGAAGEHARELRLDRARLVRVARDDRRDARARAARAAPRRRRRCGPP